MKLFSDHIRTHCGVADAGESRFHFLDRSANPTCEAGRQTLERWFRGYPRAAQHRFASRFRSANEHDSAVAELYVHALVRTCGFDVEVEKHTPAGSKPDFCVSRNGRASAYIEVTVDRGFKKLADQRNAVHRRVAQPSGNTGTSRFGRDVIILNTGSSRSVFYGPYKCTAQQRFWDDVKAKCSQHRSADLPLIVCVASNDVGTSPFVDDVSAVLMGIDGHADGIWSAADGSKPTRPAGLIHLHHCVSWALHRVVPVLWDNPWIPKRQLLRPWPFARQTWSPKGREFVFRNNRNAARGLGIHNWPRPDARQLTLS